MYDKNLRKVIISEPSYWVEKFNSLLYGAIEKFQAKNNLKQKALAKVFKLTEGRVSQIINDGEINYTIEKFVELSLKCGYVPEIKIKEISTFLNEESQVYDKRITAYNRTMIVNRTFNSEFLTDINIESLPLEGMKNNKNVEIMSFEHATIMDNNFYYEEG